MRQDRTAPFHNLFKLCGAYIGGNPEFYVILDQIEPSDDVMRATVWYLRLTGVFRRSESLKLLSDKCDVLGSDSIVSQIMCAEFPDLKQSQYIDVDAREFIAQNANAQY